jgi:hypothetical protein
MPVFGPHLVLAFLIGTRPTTSTFNPASLLPLLETDDPIGTEEPVLVPALS